jgi:hypothetical protein
MLLPVIKMFFAWMLNYCPVKFVKKVPLNVKSSTVHQILAWKLEIIDININLQDDIYFQKF